MPPISPVPLLFLLVLALQSVWSSAPQEPKVQGSAQPENFSLHHPTWSLGLQLYRSLRTASSQTNTFISPLLLANSLLALEGGAKGSTAGQFHDLLRITENEKTVRDALSRARKSVREANGTSYALHSSSTLFSKQAPKLEESFLENLQTHFGLQHVALEDAQKHTDMEKLQSWAKSGMNGEETATLEPALETRPGAMILANALHFKGFWDRGFHHENQELRSFLGTKYTKVPMMHRSGLGRGKLHLGAVLHWTSFELAPESGSKDGMDEDQDEDVKKPKIFYADHSFIVLVRDNSTGALLMIGALDHTDGPAIHDEL